MEKLHPRPAPEKPVDGGALLRLGHVHRRASPVSQGAVSQTQPAAAAGVSVAQADDQSAHLGQRPAAAVFQLWLDSSLAPGAAARLGGAHPHRSRLHDAAVLHPARLSGHHGAPANRLHQGHDHRLGR